MPVNENSVQMDAVSSIDSSGVINGCDRSTTADHVFVEVINRNCMVCWPRGEAGSYSSDPLDVAIFWILGGGDIYNMLRFAVMRDKLLVSLHGFHIMVVGENVEMWHCMLLVVAKNVDGCLCFDEPWYFLRTDESSSHQYCCRCFSQYPHM